MGKSCANSSIRSIIEENFPPGLKDGHGRSWSLRRPSTTVSEELLLSRKKCSTDVEQVNLSLHFVRNSLLRNSAQRLRTLFDIDASTEPPHAPVLQFAVLASQPYKGSLTGPPLRELSNRQYSLRLPRARLISLGSENSLLYLDGPAENETEGSPKSGISLLDDTIDG